MKAFKYFSIALVAICLASCGGQKDSEEKEEVVLTPETTQINSSDWDSSSHSSEEADSDISSSSSSSQDWDALLDSYEQYVDKYISYMKKAANGDMSALSEYPDLLEKAQEFSDQMSDAQGDMSASQWARYMKITNKMTSAVQ